MIFDPSVSAVSNLVPRTAYNTEAPNGTLPERVNPIVEDLS